LSLLTKDQLLGSSLPLLTPSFDPSEQQVVQDTEEVFRSYVFYRHQQEQEAQGAAAPADPELVSLPQEPNR
jgi:hypothetical protein